MTSLRFTLPPRQQRMPVLASGVLLLIAVVAVALGAAGFAVPLVLAVLVVLILYFLVMYGSFSELDETGIHSKRGVFRNKVTWDEVREVKLDPKSADVLIVYKNDGTSFKLGAPISGGLSTDPEYPAKVIQVMEFVKAHTHAR